MAFDFAAAIAAAAKDAKSTSLEALIMGPSGAGKSTLCGTLGIPTLYLYCSGENHGVKSVKTFGGKDITPIRIDHGCDSDDQTEMADSALSNLDEILTNKDLVRKYKAIVIDGATELEYLIRKSSVWKTACLTKKEGHNNFEEPKATINGFRPILNQLKRLQSEFGTHYAMTCLLDVKELGRNGEIIEAMPKLQGYSVAEALVQQFGDILVVGRMEKNGEVKHKLQFMTDLTKTSKDETKTVKKCLNFSPRIAGIPIGGEDGLKNLMEADLEEVIKLKVKYFSE